MDWCDIHMVTTLSGGVSFASVYEQIHSSVVTYLFHDCQRNRDCAA